MSYKKIVKVGSLVSVSKAVENFKKRREDLKNGGNPTIKTGYKNLNEATANGFFRNTINLIAAHSGVGKTALTIRIAEDVILLNKNLRVLFFTLEMPSESIIARLISNKLRATVLQLNTDESLLIPDSVYDEINKLKIDFEEYGGNNEQMFDKIDAYNTKHPDEDILVIIDHSLLVEGDSDANKISELALMLNYCKKTFKNHTYLILSQLNDAMLSHDRIIKKSLSYPMYTDIYHGRQLFQICDVVIVLNRPSDYQEQSTLYGMLDLALYKKVQTKDKILNLPIVYGHIIKGRDSGKNIIIAWVDYLKHNKLIEIPLADLLRKKQL